MTNLSQALWASTVSAASMGKPHLFGKRVSLLRSAAKAQYEELFRHFAVQKELGRGNFSVVYQVKRVSDGQLYALKHINIEDVDPKEYEDLVSEIRLSAALDHPNLMTYYEAFVERGSLFIVTNLASGDLGTLLEKRERRHELLPERQVWSYFLQLALGVQYLHKNRVLHRDLKPHNLLITEGGLLKIGDLGISQLLDHVFTRKLMGTPHYVSPEMWCRRPYSFSADIWAMGCILHELCSLRPLFLPAGRPTDKCIKACVLGGLCEPIPTRYGLDLWEIIRRCLVPNPAKRPTIDEILAMPQVKAHMYLLPPEVQPHRDQSNGRKATLPGLFRISVSADKWAMLNEVLPPSKYSTGGGVADSLRQRIPRPRSCPDLAQLLAAGAAGAAGTAAMPQGASAPGGLSSLFRFSAAYPVQHGGAPPAERLRRASAQVGSGLGGGGGGGGGGSAQQEDGGQGGPGVDGRSGVSSPAGRAVGSNLPLRRSKSLGDIIRAKPPEPSVGNLPPAFRGAFGSGNGSGAFDSGSGGSGGGTTGCFSWGFDPSPLEFGSAAGSSPFVRAVLESRLPAGRPALSTIEQEPSDYNSSYHGGSSYAGSYHGGSYHGGSYHGGSYHGGSYHGGSYQGAGAYMGNGSFTGGSSYKGAGGYVGNGSYTGAGSCAGGGSQGSVQGAGSLKGAGSLPGSLHRAGSTSVEASFRNGRLYSPLAEVQAVFGVSPSGSGSLPSSLQSGSIKGGKEGKKAGLKSRLRRLFLGRS